ncbi:hypothetical protein EOL96_07245 [Candidatus Saccharibacteria bacterium]|nr:hypothetical protein [Candidatus Saccharibacteria bacterium]
MNDKELDEILNKRTEWLEKYLEKDLDDFTGMHTTKGIPEDGFYSLDVNREIMAWHTRKLNEARIDEIRRTRPHLTYPGMVYYGERMNELRGAETGEVK